MDIPLVEPGTVGPCPVAPDALQGIVRQQTNPARWNGEGWPGFVWAYAAYSAFNGLATWLILSGRI